MPFVTSVIDDGVDAALANITYIALLDASLTEIAGGSPAYARKPVSWAASSSGLADNSGAIVFDVQSGDAVFFYGFTNHVSTGDGKTLGWWPANDASVGAQSVQGGTAAASTDLITAPAHGLSTDHRVVFMDLGGGGLPAGLTEGVVYYVLASGLTADVFKVSTSSGGSAVNITGDGDLFFIRCIPTTFAGQGTYTIGSGALDTLGTLI